MTINREGAFFRVFGLPRETNHRQCSYPCFHGHPSYTSESDLRVSDHGCHTHLGRKSLSRLVLVFWPLFDHSTRREEASHECVFKKTVELGEGIVVDAQGPERDGVAKVALEDCASSC